LNFTVKAASDDAYQRLIRQFVSHYREHLFNDHWGGQAVLTPRNLLRIRMLSCGLDTEQANKIWEPFLDWVGRAPNDYSHQERVSISSILARRYWDVQWWKDHWPEVAFPDTNPVAGLLDYALAHLMPQPVRFQMDQRPGAGPNNVWWTGDGGEVGWFLWGFQSLWLPASLLESDAQEQLTDALFTGSRYHDFELHFFKGLAGAPQDAITAAQDTAMNPAVLTAFALVIAANRNQGFAYPGVSGHEPSAAKAHQASARRPFMIAELKSLLEIATPE
jgi:hypothetical protein